MSESIDLKQNFDISSFLGQLSKAEEQVSSLKAELEETPGTPKALNAGLDRTQHTINMLEKKAHTVNKLSDGRKNAVVGDLMAGLEEINMSTQLFSEGGKFSTSLAKQMFDGFPEAVKKELSSSTREIEKMIRSSLGSIKSFGVSNMARDILMTDRAGEIFGRRFKKTSSDQFAKYIEMQLPHALPAYMMEEYQMLSKGTVSKINASIHPYEMIPKAFQAAFKNKNYTSSGSSNSLFMQEEQRKMLRNLISENDAAMRAAEKVDGMIRRSTAGRAQLNRNITQAQYDQFKSNMWKDWVLRASGSQSNRVDLFADNLSASDERKLLSRMTGSSAGRVLSAMNSLDPFETATAWATSTKQKGYETLKKEARRELEQYEIARFRFGDVFSGKEKWRPVALSESQNTRLLGLSGMHNQFTDKVAVLDLAGYDKENKEHQKLLEQLSSGKEVSLPGSNKKYIAQNLHGTGRNTTFRLIEAEAYKAVRDREKAWLEQQGFAFSGNNYWNNLVGEDYVFESEEALRKHYDATGKGWTPGYQVRSQQRDKNFGIVDFSKISDAGQKAKQADGLAWMAKGILPEGSIQARIGISGKGVLNEMPFKTMGDWAVNAGLIKPGERFILPGPRGDVDVTDQNGISDVSQVKNISAYGNFKSGEEMNRAFTALMQRYGISTVTSFGNAESKVDSLGHQAMMFMKLSPEIVEKQMAAADRRLKMLDTEAGIREFILSDPNDYLAKMLREGKIQPTDNIIQSRVQKEKDSIISRLASGEWLDFDGSVSGYNQKVNKTLMTSLVEFGGGSREEKIQKLRKLMKDKGLTREYTDDEIAGIWGLGGVKGGAIVDFLRPDEEFVAVNRAPNGIAQFVSGKNYAKLARDVYKKFGISTNGVFLSEEDMLTLGDADFDGDGVKVMYGDTAHEMGRASDLYNEIINKLAITSSAQHVKDNNGVSGSVTDTPEQRRRAAEDSIAAVMAMGLTSSAGEKATMFDLTDPRNRDMLIAAVQSNPAYSIATVLGKRGGHVELTKEMWAASRLGKTWQKQPSKYSNLFNVTGKDDIDIPDEEDIYVSDEGIKVNLAQLREMEIDKINLPSAYQDSTQVGLRMASQLGSSPEGEKRRRAVLEALDRVIGYGGVGDKSKALLQNLRFLKLGMATGDRGSTTGEEDDVLAAQISEAYKEVTDLAKSKVIGGGKVKLDDGTEKQYGEYLSELQKQAGIDVAKAYLYSYGATTRRIKAVYGEEEGSKIVADLVQHDGVDMPNAVVSSAEQLLSGTSQVSQPAKQDLVGFKGRKPKARKRKQAQRNVEKMEEIENAVEEKIDDSISIFEQYEKIKTFEGSLQAEKELSEYIKQISGKWYKTHTKVDEDPEKSFYALSLYELKKAQNQYDIASTHGDSAVFGSGTATGENQFAELQGMESNYFLATRAHLTQSGENAVESLRKSVQGVGTEFDKQLETLESWSQKVLSLQRQQDAFKESREKYSSKANSDLEADAAAITNQEKRIAEAKELERQGRENLLKSNSLRFSDSVDQFMYEITGKTASRKDKIAREVELRKEQLQKERNALNEAHLKNLLSEDAYSELTSKFDSAESYVNEKYKAELEKQYEEKTRKEVESLVHHENRLDLAHRRRAIDNTHYGRELGRVEAELEQRKHFDEIGQLKLDQLKVENAPTKEIDKLTEALSRNKQAMENLEGARGKLSAGMQVLGDAITRVASRLGRQLMAKATNELKRFTLEFSDDMAEIQSITLKSDKEMQEVRSSTLNDAVRLKTSVSNVSSIKADLYRQGLSDTQVDDRTESIQKFAKTSGAKVEDATKIITTALQNDLVGSAEEAMDALVALGDSAATTAKQIGDAMQKCAASAKVANVSYGELTSMLTVMTSMTQLSGKQVGTAMNTVQTRLHSVTKSGYAQELSGEKTTLNDVEAALSTIGVSLRDDQTGGWRDSTDVLLDIAKRWQGMNDIQKSLVSTSVAATRQGNMFQTLMEGLSEDGGETFAEYLNLAENSQGITDKKYEVSVRSLSAAIDTLTASYDRLVAGVESSQIGQTVLDFVSGILEGFGTLGEELPEVAAGLTGIITPLSIVVGLIQAAKGGSGVGLFAGLGVAGLGMWIGSAIGKNSTANETAATQRKEQAASSYSNYITEINRRNESRNSLISETVSLGEQYDKLGEAMDGASSKKLESNLSSLITMFPELQGKISDASSVLSQWKTITDGAAESVKALTAEEQNYAEIKAKVAASENFDDYVEEKIKEVTDKNVGISRDEIISFALGNKQNRTNSMYSQEHQKALYYAGQLNEDTANNKAQKDLMGHVYEGKNIEDPLSQSILSNYASSWWWKDEIISDGKYNETFQQKYIDEYIKPDYANKQSFKVFDSEKNIADFIASGDYSFSNEFSNLLSLIYDLNGQTIGLDSLYSNKNEFIENLQTSNNKLKLPENSQILKNQTNQIYSAAQGTHSGINQLYEQNQEALDFAYGESVSHYISEYVSDYRFNHSGDELLATAVRKAFIESITNSETGAVDWSKINAGYLNSEMPQIYEKVLAEGKEKYLSVEDYPYQMWRDVGNGFKRQEVFESVEQAEAYLKEQYGEENYKTYLGDILDSNGNKVFRSADQIQNEQYLNWLKENQSYVSQMNALSRFADESSSLDDFAEKVPVDFDNLAGLLGQNDTLLKAWESTRTGNLSFDVFKKILRGQITGTNLLGHSDYIGMLPSFFGEDFMAQLATGTYDTTSEENRSLLATAMTDPGMLDQLDAMKEKYPELTEVIDHMTQGVQLNAEEQKKLARTMEIEGVRATEKYNKNVEKIADTYDAILKGGKDAEDAVQDLNQQMKQRDYAQYSLNRFKAGKANTQDFSVLSQFFGAEEEEIKKASKDLGSETAQWYIDSWGRELASYDQDLANVIEESVLAPINDFLANNRDIDIPLKADGTVDVSSLIAAINNAGANINATAAAYACTLSLQADDHQLKVIFNQSGKNKSGGGGGGGKSAADKLIENIKRQLTEREHIIKMIQYQETKYENKGEYGNLNKMIELENEAQNQYKLALEESLDSLKAQLAKTKKGSDDWYSLREQILATEEAIEETSITIDENTEKIEENAEAIRQSRINLEDIVNGEIEARIQKERDMLAGSVSMQDVILGAIKQRYQDEWDLIKKDIERKKEALNEEKALIDERLNARKDAEDQAKKYEELAEYQRQLAYISMDSTRTKDAAELRKKIADLESELAWDIAEDEAEATKTKLDDELAAYDDYVTAGDEDLAAFLEDANNFADEVNKVLGLSHDELMNWQKTNVKEYAHSLDDAKEQLLQTWDDLFKQMFGITDTYWDQINNILSTKDSFLEYMKDSDEYKNASETDKESMQYKWGEAYEDWIAANKTDAEYSHSDENLENIGAQTTTKKTNTQKNEVAEWAKNAATNLISNIASGAKYLSSIVNVGSVVSKIFGYNEGGNVDYTGQAMVHGTPSRPEAFLSADDRILVRSMIDSLSYAKYVPNVQNIDTGYGTSTARVDEVNIVINQAELNTDEDIENVARKVGEAFTRDLMKAGFNTTKIGF